MQPMADIERICMRKPPDFFESLHAAGALGKLRASIARRSVRPGCPVGAGGIFTVAIALTPRSRPAGDTSCIFPGKTSWRPILT
jgi:hypothetical protein